MICPKCESEYIENISICPDCNIDLIPVEEFEGNLVHHADWIIIYTCGDNIEAEMIKANLEGAGIESLILSQKDKNFPAPGDFSVVKLLVQKKDADEAKAFIDDINKPEEE
ncbi:MAG: DUF2007 domain-containing protein [Melioribacteraceae bacterium]|nr:DUF2007 domain-containing protein [Melioribacteraceae bacterium]